MSISPNTSPDELNSEYYLKNKATCEAWEDLVYKYNGRIKGNYNSWSFFIRSIVKINQEWTIDIDKSTYSGGSLWLTSRFQNLKERVVLRTRVSMDISELRIKKGVLERGKEEHLVLEQIKELAPEIFDIEYLDIEINDGILEIVIQYHIDCTELVEKLIRSSI